MANSYILHFEVKVAYHIVEILSYKEKFQLKGAICKKLSKTLIIINRMWGSKSNVKDFSSR